MLISSLLALSAAVAAPDGVALADGAASADMPYIAADRVDQLDPPARNAAPDPASAQPASAQPAPALASDPAPQAGPQDTAAMAEAVDDAILLRDPWAKPNQAIFKFDLFFEKNLLAPVAHGYSAVVPDGARFHISNLILNLDEPSTMLNALLQLKVGRAVKSGVRFVLNSTLGIAGLFDVAAAGGLPRRVADFGQTLGRYGVKPGPYVMLPLLGPSNVRDGFGRLVDTLTDPVGFVIGGLFTSWPGAGRYVAEGVNWRQQNEGVIKAVRGASDPYAFARSAYSQQRAAVIQDATGKAATLPDF